jgi:DNA-binding FadR family transcriptional regulator
MVAQMLDATSPSRGSTPIRNFVLAAIADGTLPKGAKLPTERALAARLGLSRAAVRKELAALEVEGHVTRKVGSGTYVAERAGASALITGVSLHQLLEARIVMEPQLAAVAVANATPADLQQIEGWLGKCAAAGDVDAFEAADHGFHAAIAAATHNGLLIAAYDLICGLRASGEWRALKLRRNLDAPGRKADVLVEHRDVFEAIRDHDQTAAREAMLRHMTGVRRNLFPV